MLIKEELRFWLKTGSFKYIPYHIARQHLVDLLGAPSWQFPPPEEKQLPAICGWGKFEFHFWDDTIDSPLEGIVFKPYSGIPEKSRLFCNYHRLTSKTDITKFISFLIRHDIGFEERLPMWQDEDERLLCTEGNVEVIFDCQRHPGYYTLDKIVKFSNYDEIYNRMVRPQDKGNKLD